MIFNYDAWLTTPPEEPEPREGTWTADVCVYQEKENGDIIEIESLTFEWYAPEDDDVLFKSELEYVMECVDFEIPEGADVEVESLRFEADEEYEYEPDYDDMWD